MNLKERLQNLKSGGSTNEPEIKEEDKPQSETIFQCDCGSHIRGECPDCDAAASDGNGEDTSEEFSSDIQERLDAIGGEKAVNPPPVDEEVDETAGEAAGLEPCPNCGKAFKHLSRHKCKLAPKTEPAEPEENPEDKILEQTDKTEDEVLDQVGELDPNAPNISALLKVVGETIGEQVAKEHVRLLEFLEEKLPIMTSLPLDVKNCEVSVLAEPEIEAGFTLLIDCLPLDLRVSEIQHFDYIIKPLGDAVARENNVPHWSTIDYAKGPGLLAAKLERYLDHEKPTGFMVVDSSTAEARACLHVLKNYAESVIRGMR